MESGTAGASTEATTTNGTGAPAAREQIDVRNPATGASIAKLDVSSPDEVAATVARVRANQADWEAMGIEGRYHWLGKLRDWLLDNSERVARHDAARDRQGPRRRRERAASTSPT